MKHTYSSAGFPRAVNVTILYENGDTMQETEVQQILDLLQKMNRRRAARGGSRFKYMVHSSDLETTAQQEKQVQKAINTTFGDNQVFVTIEYRDGKTIEKNKMLLSTENARLLDEFTDRITD